MTPASASDRRADIVAARTVGIGIGLVVFMAVWSIGVSVTVRVWGPPTSALVAMAIALVVGATTTAVAGNRLVRRTAGGPSRQSLRGERSM